MKTLDDLITELEGDPAKGRCVFVRADLNVPLDGTTITDDGRIRASVPTLLQLSDAGARVVVIAHLGRPKGAPDPAYSLEPVAGRLSELLGRPVAFATDTVGTSAAETVAGLEDGDVALLENVRFNDGETSKDDEVRGSFADQLAQLADEAGITLIQMAIAFVIRHPAVTAAIIGPRTMEHLESQLAALDVELSDEILDRIDEIVPPGTNVNPADTGWDTPDLLPEARRR